MKLSDEAKELKRNYYRKYQQNNKDRYKESSRKYWENKAIKEKELKGAFINE